MTFALGCHLTEKHEVQINSSFRLLFMPPGQLHDRNFSFIGCKALCKVLCSNRSIRILHLDGNRFNDDCAQLFAEVFSQNECITYMNLNKNFFENDATGRILGQSLIENQTLQELHLAWNRLSSKACGYILKQLGTNAYLTTLDLSWNAAALFAAKALNDLLKKNAIIEKIYLEHNKFNTECATYIGKGLAKNETLKILSLNGNPLESSGCYATIRPLLKHPTCSLQSISFIGIIVNQDFLDLVSELSGVLPQLQVKIGSEREQEPD
jgi:Ran GTPase-activating protein (RanGAP) involved in mRNA processing and transport